MAEEGSKLARKALRSSYISTVFSISLVLFLMGTLGMLLLNANRISDYVKENLTVTVMLKAEASDVDIQSITKNLEGNTFIKNVVYVNKDTAAKNLQRELGEDFVAFLGYNPLLPSLDVQLKAEYSTQQNIDELQNMLRQNSVVKETYYQQSLVTSINKNIRTISLVILGFSALLFFIAGALINNTIRLALYSKRLLIKSMKLVGATRNFIRKPFLINGILQGLYGALIADAMLMILFYYAKKEVNELMFFEDAKTTGIVLASVIVLGIIVSGFSTYFAVNKYLRQRTEDLY
jgi:cell division transport system permease protein